MSRKVAGGAGTAKAFAVSSRIALDSSAIDCAAIHRCHSGTPLRIGGSSRPVPSMRSRRAARYMACTTSWTFGIATCTALVTSSTRRSSSSERDGRRSRRSTEAPTRGCKVETASSRIAFVSAIKLRPTLGRAADQPAVKNAGWADSASNAGSIHPIRRVWRTSSLTAPRTAAWSSFAAWPAAFDRPGPASSANVGSTLTPSGLSTSHVASPSGRPRA